MGANGALVKEVISLGLRMFANLYNNIDNNVIWVHKVPLSMNVFHLAFECLLN